MLLLRPVNPVNPVFKNMNSITHRSRDWRIPVAWLALCVVWSSTWLVIKIGLRDLPPVSFVAVRFVVAALVLVLISIGRARLLPPNRADYFVLASTGLLMFALNYALLFWAELYVSSGLAAVIQASIPIFGMIFAHWMLPDEPLRWQRLVGALVAILGVAFICARLLSFNGWLAFLGGVGVTIGAASAAFSNVVLKAKKIQLAPSMLAAWQMIFGIVPLVLLGLALDGNPLGFHWTGRALLCLLYLAVIGSSFTFLLLYWLMPRMSVTNLQTIALITPPGAIALGWAFGDEKFSAWSLLGAALVLLGVWLIFRRLDAPKPVAVGAALPVEGKIIGPGSGESVP
jgi:drug/metabolite transporter (DMT)-like permease